MKFLRHLMKLVRHLMKLVKYLMKLARRLVKSRYIPCIVTNFTNICTFFTKFRMFFMIFCKFFSKSGHKVKGQWLRFQDPESDWFVKYGHAAFFCQRMMDSCTTRADNQSASSSKQYFLFLSVYSYKYVNANN